jgi:hypothetical protein
MNFGKLNLAVTPPACRLDGENLAPALDIRCGDYLKILARPCPKTPGSCFKWFEMPIRNQIPVAPLEGLHPAPFLLGAFFPAFSLSNFRICTMAPLVSRHSFLAPTKSPSLGKPDKRCKSPFCQSLGNRCPGHHNTIALPLDVFTAVTVPYPVSSSHTGTSLVRRPAHAVSTKGIRVVSHG